MNGDNYTPREGALAQRLIAHLGTCDEGTTFSSAEVADMFDSARSGSISAHLKTVVDAGLLAVTKVGRTNRYGLPTAPMPTDGPLTLASHGDGDLTFRGATVGEDGTVLLTITQLNQLLAFVTTPHVQRAPGIAEPA